MKINLEFLKSIILGPKYSEEQNGRYPDEDEDIKHDSSDEEIEDDNTPPKTGQLNSTDITSKPNTNASSTAQNKPHSSIGEMLNATRGVRFETTSNQHPPSTSSDTTSFESGIPGMIMTSKVVPVSNSFSPSPGSSILSSCSPIAFSPILGFGHLNSSLNNSLDFEDQSPPKIINTNISTTTTTSTTTSTTTTTTRGAKLNSSQATVNSNIKKKARPPNHNHDRKQRTLFEKIYTESGFKSIKSWYERNTANSNFIIGESQFVLLLRYLTDYNHYQILNIFDCLDRDDIGYIGFEEFFILIALFSSRECGQTTKFLYQHSQAIYEIISGFSFNSDTSSTLKKLRFSRSQSGNNNSDSPSSSEPTTPSSTTSISSNVSANVPASIDEVYINFSKFCKFGNIIGIGPDTINSHVQKFNYPNLEKITFDIFLLLYFVILDEYDRSSYYSFHKELYYDQDYNEWISPSNKLNNSVNHSSSSSSSNNSPTTATTTTTTTLASSTNSQSIKISNNPVHNSQLNINSINSLNSNSPNNNPNNVISPKSSPTSPNGKNPMTAIPLTLPTQIHEFEDLKHFIESLKLTSDQKQYLKDQFKIHNISSIQVLNQVVTDSTNILQIIKKTGPRKILLKSLHHYNQSKNPNSTSSTNNSSNTQPNTPKRNSSSFLK